MSHYMRAEKKQFFRNAQDYIIRPLLRQRETGQLCDVVLSINGRSFYAHRAILALWSPYFLSMFTCEMIEKSSKEIDLSESLILNDDTVFSNILDYMYTGSLTVSVSNVDDILRVSDFLLLDDVKEYCRQFYLDLGNLDLSNCLRVKFLTENHNLLEVSEACQKIIESRFHDYLIHNDEILEIPPPYFFLLLEDPRTVHQTSYNELKRLIQRWVNYSKENREMYQSDLCACIKLWVYDTGDGACGSFGQGIKQRDLSIFMQSSLSDAIRRDAEGHMSCMLKENVLHESISVNDTICPVLYAVICNQGMKFLRILVYSIYSQKWFQFPISSEKLSQMIPSRQTVCSLVAHRNCLYMYLCPSFPYPSDMLKINILVVDLLKGQPAVYSFRTADYYNPTYRTTLTNYRSVPPAVAVCGHNLYVIGNKEGAGNLFQCSLTNHQYKCHQIPGSRFISLARAAVRNDRYIFLWFRHRTGPSEEFCIKKSIGFVMFDTKSKVFNSWEISPPEISYDDFVKPYTLCVRDDTVLIYHPGKPALVLDEVRCKWVTSLRKVPTLGSLTDNLIDVYGYQIQAATDNSIFILNNPAPYTTSLHEISEMYPQTIIHRPPPIDNLSLVTFGYLTKSDLMELDTVEYYDDAYANALQVTMRFSDPDTDDSGTTHSGHDTDNDFEYDDDIYDYDYDLDGEFGFSL